MSTEKRIPKQKKLCKVLKFSLIGIGLLLCAELSLRMLGFGQPLIYEANANYEYRCVPNQSVRRLGNLNTTNNLGMRGENPSPKAIKVLKIGDSIIHGGSLTDDSELATTILSKKLTDYLKKETQVLNISAGSWGPDNAYYFLKTYGTFGAEVMVIFFSSHDASDIMANSSPIGQSVDHPNAYYPFAFMELYERYIIKRKIFNLQPSLAVHPTLKESYPNSGFNALIDLSNQGNMTVLAVLHPNSLELSIGTYNKNGKAIIDLFHSKHIEVIKGVNFLEKDCYRDGIHLNKKGQKVYADQLYPHLCKLLEYSISN